MGTSLDIFAVPPTSAIAIMLWMILHIPHPLVPNPTPEEFHGIDAPRRDHCRRFPVRVRQVRQNYRPALGVAAVGPVRHRHLQCPAHLGLTRTIATPGH